MNEMNTESNTAYFMHLAFSRGGADNVELEAKRYSIEDFAKRLSKPRIAAKEGSYYIRGGNLAEPKRADANLLTAELIILDGDSRIDPNTGEVLSGAPPLDAVCDALDELNYTYVAHTSHSYRPGEMWKYRIVMPARLGDQEALAASVDYVIDQLHDRNVWLNDVVENRRWSQAWYLPRVTDEEARLAFRHRQNLGGRTFPVRDALEHAAAKRRAAEAIAKARQNPLPRPSLGQERESVIETFNREHGFDWVHQQLEAAGYTFKYKKGDDYRYLRPGSETGMAGVSVFKGAQGDWCTYSHHGGADPLSGKLCDPFELYAIFQHSGSRSNAARWLLRERDSSAIVAAQKITDAIAHAQSAVEADAEVEDTDTQEEQDAASEPSEQPQERLPRIRVELEEDMKSEPVRWLVDNLIPAGGLVGLFGRPGSYKSFVSLAIAGAVASHTDFLGRSTEPGDVVYVAAEGGSGLKRRTTAMRMRHGLDFEGRLGFVRAQLDLRSSVDDMELLIEAIAKTGLKPKLLVFDTLNRLYGGGDENDAGNMSAFLSIIGGLQQAFDGATALVVHHQGHAEARMRGSSSLLGAVDTELHVTKVLETETSRLGQLAVTKQKDGENNVTVSYSMEVVGTDPIDPHETSLAVVLAEDEQMPVNKTARRTNDEKIALDALHHALMQFGRTATSSLMPAGVQIVEEKHWRAEFYARRPGDGYEDKKKAIEATRKAFGRARSRLIGSSEIGHRDGQYWVIEHSFSSFDDFGQEF
jgi:hypothetical protein